MITICNLTFSFIKDLERRLRKYHEFLFYFYLFFLPETEDIVTMYNNKITKIMQMLSRAYVRTLAFSFFPNKVILMRTSEHELETTLPREWRERGWIKCQKNILDLTSFSTYRHFSSTCKWYLLFKKSNFVKK